MLSAFAYRKFFQLLFSRAAREGVEVIGVNPAFTSVIGAVQFASGYGLSSHGAAAVAIARRGLRFGERLRSRSAFPLPARNRGKPVWSDWRRVAQRLRAARARGRCPSEGGRGRGNPYPRRHPPGARVLAKARLGMVLPRHRGATPRRKRSGKLFVRPAWYKWPWVSGTVMLGSFARPASARV